PESFAASYEAVSVLSSGAWAASTNAVTTGPAVVIEIAELLSLPVENLLTPDLLRRLAWNPPEPLTPETVAAELSRGGARSWQIDATAGPLVTAFVEAAQAPEESTETAS
ncbi:hypothetical protein NB037_12920, partial [Rathayibacter sp. ZW T2_19]|nr:hypothetical protein [Rathayibacter rubneri]